MLKKTITCNDYDGVERTEDFFFNLTKAEVAELAFGTTGGLDNMLKKIVAEHDNKRIMEIFKDIVLRAYGEKSADGKRFMKSKEISDGFAQTEAYSELFMEMLSDTEKAIAFVNGILPPELAQQATSTPTLVPMN